jgi:hypothetical protein
MSKMVAGRETYKLIWTPQDTQKVLKFSGVVEDQERMWKNPH